MTTSSDQADGLDDNESGDSVMQEELLLLEAIYINELTLQKDDKDWPFCISVCLHPATGDVQEQQYVCLTLELSPPPDYPISPPRIHIRNPRGLAEEHITDLRKTLKEMAQERRGDPMLYELIECAKDSLTHGNVPHGHCVICRDDFDTETDFTRTACYHYFHSHCLLRYVKHSVSQAADEAQRSLPHSDSGSDEQVVCPVCREVITYDLAALGNAKTIPGGDDVFRPNASVRKLQRQMAALFKKQKAKGGIIDVEAEKNKFLLPQGPVYLPGVQEDTEAEVLPSEMVCCSRDLLFKERVPQDGHDTRQCDIQDRRFKDYPSHRGRGRGRGRGRRWEQNLHLSDGDRHFGRPRSGRRNERNQGESQHNERRNETFPRESQQSERRNETNLREGQRNERRNETFPREIQPNERRNETNLREGQQNERINETNLREGQTSERRNETNLREGQPNERRNEAFPRAGRRNEMTRQRRSPSGRVRQGAEGTSVGRPEKENVHCGMTSSSRETSSHESGRPQSGNRRLAGGRRGNRGRASHCPDPDRPCNRNPNPHHRDRCTGIIETDRKKTDCGTNPSVTSCPTPCREQGSKGERESVRENPVDTLGKRPPPGFQMGNRPPPGFENISTGL